MKATLKFNLNDPEDRMEHLRAVKSTDLCLVLLDIDNHLRGIIKHGQDEKEADVCQDVRGNLYMFMETRGVILDELIN